MEKKKKWRRRSAEIEVKEMEEKMVYRDGGEDVRSQTSTVSESPSHTPALFKCDAQTVVGVARRCEGRPDAGEPPPAPRCMRLRGEFMRLPLCVGAVRGGS